MDIDISGCIILATNWKEGESEGETERTDFSSKYSEQVLRNFLMFSYNLKRWKHEFINSEKNDGWPSCLPRLCLYGQGGDLRTLTARGSDQC